jgi:chromosome partitioning protein
VPQRPAGLTSESVFGAADALVVPTIPTTLSERTLDQLTDFLAEHPPAPMVLPFVSMLDRRKRLQRETVAQLLGGNAGFLPTTIPNASVIEQMGIQRSPVAVFAPRSPAALAFERLWGDIAARIWV